MSNLIQSIYFYLFANVENDEKIFEVDAIKNGWKFEITFYKFDTSYCKNSTSLSEMSLLYLICFAKKVSFDVINKNKSFIEGFMHKTFRMKIIFSLLANRICELFKRDDKNKNNCSNLILLNSTNNLLQKKSKNIYNYLKRIEMLYLIVDKTYIDIESKYY